MSCFETLLSAHLLLVLSACRGSTDSPTDSPTDTTTETGTPKGLDLCTVEASKGGYVGVNATSSGYEGSLKRTTGYHAVDLGEACPDIADMPRLSHDNCCPDHVFEGTVCAFVNKSENLVHVSGPYGGYWTDPKNAPKETTSDSGYYGTYNVSSPRDVCWYEGLFVVTDICCGRPLLHEGQPVVADARSSGERSGWTAGSVPDVDGLHPAARAAAGEYWLSAALLEHASVASFARVTLELMRYGAPPELLVGSQQAGLEEVEHAQRCFALASAYLGSPVGPGELPLTSATDLAPDLGALAEAVVREGCIGETLAAVDAAARLAGATDQAVRDALEQIVREESRHAALAWATLRWVLTRDPSLRSRVGAVFSEERAKVEAGSTSQVDVPDGAAAHGLLASSMRDRLLADAWSRVVEPAWAATGLG